MSPRFLMVIILAAALLGVVGTNGPTLPSGVAPSPAVVVAPQAPVPGPLDWKFIPQAKGVADIPVEFRNLNKMGSCVHCSTANCLEWMGLHNKAVEWRKTYIGGENPSNHLEKLQSSGLKFVMTTGRDSADEFLDWVIGTRRCAGVADKPAHCRNLVGKITQNGKEYAVILDNNPPLVPHLEEWNSWKQEWLSLGAWGFTIVSGQIPPPVPKD